MTTKEAAKALPEYMSVPVAQLVESATNPRKAFDESRLEELAESIRSKGVLVPLLVRQRNGNFEIVAGARRHRAAVRAGLAEIPVRLTTLNDDAEALEAQMVENLQRSDMHPFEEAQGFRALLEWEGARYDIAKIAAKTGKSAAYVAKRLRLLDLTQSAADSFLAGHIGIEHALLLAKLSPDVQAKALERCFEGYFAGSEAERSLVPVSRLQAWIGQNVYLNLQSVPFSKEDETLVPEAGSCTNCPKRTGFNTLLFSEVREDSCSDAVCFNRKLDAHIAQRVANQSNLIQISENYVDSGGTSILPRHDYVEVVAPKSRVRGEKRLEQKICSHLVPAIHADGINKGRLVKICADLSCKVHFGEREKLGNQRLELRTERATARRKAKQALAFRHLLLAEVLKRVNPRLDIGQMRMVTRFVLKSLSHELACRLAKRHGLQNPKDAREWQVAEKARALYKKADANSLAVLLFEAVLIGSAGNTAEHCDDDLLGEAAALYKVDLKKLRSKALNAEKAAACKKAQIPSASEKSKRGTKLACKQ